VFKWQMFFTAVDTRGSIKGMASVEDCYVTT
jgi:hypothetical protein